MYGLSDKKMAVVERWPLRLVGVRLCNKLFTVWTQQGPGVSIQKLNTHELPYKNAQTHSFFLLQTTKQCRCIYKSLPAACSGVLFVTLSKTKTLALCSKRHSTHSLQKKTEETMILSVRTSEGTKQKVLKTFMSSRRHMN